jgi:hypothetical protein
MNRSRYLCKAVGLMLLFAGVCGCTALPSVVPGAGTIADISESLGKAKEAIIEKVTTSTGSVRDVDRYCDAMEEPSYAVTDNVTAIVIGTGMQIFQVNQNTNFKNVSMSPINLDKMAKTISTQYVWMPVSFEQMIGDQLHANMVKDSQILERNARRNRNLYTKADTALARAKKEYTKLPYAIQLYLIGGEAINAEALPAGYLYVTRSAANDLDEDALQLVLGHEMAHIAKRHTSKQIQQRLVDTGLATEMLKNILENRSMQGLNKVVSAQRVIESFNGLFARYDQDQELQADACSIGGMVRAGADPLKAREEYVRKRGTQDTTEKPKHKNLTEHPDDKARDQFFRQAYQHHRQKKQTACAGASLGCEGRIEAANSR